MKEERLHTDLKEVRRELQKVANELDLPLNDCRICYNGQSVEIAGISVFQMK